MQQVPNSGRIGAPRCQSLLNRVPKPIMAMLPDEHQHLDHLFGSALLAMPIHQGLPGLIETCWPEAGPALLLQWPRSRQCTRLAIEHIEIMFQVEDLLLAPVTPLVASDTAAVVPEFHPACIGLGVHFRSCLQRRRVCVGQHLGATQTVYRGEARLRQVHSLCGQWQQMLPLHYQSGSHTLLSPCDGPPLIFATTGDELPVQVGDVESLGHRHPVIPAKVANFPFHAPLLVAFARCAELTLVSPMGTEGDEPRRLFPPLPAQNLLYGRTEIVVTKPAKHAREVGERPLVALQKRLLRRMEKGTVECRAWRSPATWSALRRGRRKHRTNPLVPPHPSRNSGERTSPEPSNPGRVCAPERHRGPSVHRAEPAASHVGSAPRSDGLCVAASAVPSCPSPESDLRT